jgi:hypothetical protein
MTIIAFSALFDFLIALETWLHHFNIESKQHPAHSLHSLLQYTYFGADFFCKLLPYYLITKNTKSPNI